MGREIRMVPPNWVHPTREDGSGYLKPMYDQSFADAAVEWKKGFLEWEAPDAERRNDPYKSGLEYWEWECGTPDPEYYRPWEDDEATWYQVWETVSEGTPVTPPFSTQDELVSYLAKNGDEWDQKSGHGGWGFESAEKFVKGSGWLPSGLYTGGKFYTSRDIPELEMETTDA